MARVRTRSIPWDSGPIGKSSIWAFHFADGRNFDSKGWTAPSFTYSPTGLWESVGLSMDHTNPGPPYRTGGGLMLYDASNAPSVANVGVYYNDDSQLDQKYEGGFVPSGPPSSLGGYFGQGSPYLAGSNPKDSFHSRGDVSNQGPGAWSKYAPNNPSANLGVFLAQLEKLPRQLSETASFYNDLWKSLDGGWAFGPKKLARYWLTTQFGWMPFLSDIRKMVHTLRRTHEAYQRFKRYNGQWERRGGSVSHTQNETVVASSSTSSAHWPGLTTKFYKDTTGNTGRFENRLIQSQRVWYTASYRYYVPPMTVRYSEDFRWFRQLGLFPSPKMVWDLIPWSWLVDWFSNAGDVIKNIELDGIDNLVSKGAYLMGSTEYHFVLTSTAEMRHGPINATWSTKINWKTRDIANPFGFGLTWNQLTPRQLSLLSALGIDRT